MNFTEIRVPTNKFVVCIDSRSRNMDLYPNAFDYTAEFQKTFKNIVSIELVAAIYDGVSTDRYVNLMIDEMDSDIVSNTNVSNGSFTQLPLTLTINQYTSDQYKSIKTFDHPLAKLSKLTIRFMGINALPYPISEHYLRFELVCCKYESTIESNNMEVASSVVHMYRPVPKTLSSVDSGYITDPYLLLGVEKGLLSLPTVVAAFKQKCNSMKLKGSTQWEYNKLKQAFKELASKCK